MRALVKVDVSKSSKLHAYTCTHTTFRAVLNKKQHISSYILHNIPSTPPTCSLGPGLLQTMWASTLTLRTSQSAGLKGQGSRAVQTLAQTKYHGSLHLGSKNLWKFRPGRIWFHMSRLARCYIEVIFQRDQEGNCIDILLLACLHKLYIWHRGGPNTTIKSKTAQTISTLVQCVNVLEKKHDNNIYGGGVGMKALQSQPWKPWYAYVRCVKLMHFLIFSWRCQKYWQKKQSAANRTLINLKVYHRLNQS